MAPALLLPVPAVGPGWDLGGIRVFLGSAGFVQLLSPLRALPGGGTAETDASQGKSREQKPGMGCGAAGTGMDGASPVLAASRKT